LPTIRRNWKRKVYACIRSHGANDATHWLEFMRGGSFLFCCWRFFTARPWSFFCTSQDITHSSNPTTSLHHYFGMCSIAIFRAAPVLERVSPSPHMFGEFWRYAVFERVTAYRHSSNATHDKKADMRSTQTNRSLLSLQTLPS